MKQVAFFLIFMGFFLSGNAQGFFSDQIMISNEANGPRCILAADIDNDEDMDVISASSEDNKIAWYENDGNGNFGEQNIIDTNTYFAVFICTGDLDGDGYIDVISVSHGEGRISWYKNDGNGSFESQNIITTNADGATSVFACDLDNDGDPDVLSASYNDDKIAWYENDGAGNFGGQKIITTNADGATYVYANDIDGDGDMDVLSASFYDNKIVWYENDGDGNFGNPNIITSYSMLATSVFATDLDGDGDSDVLSASSGDNKIAWYENDGDGNFGNQKVITTNADGATSIYAIDLDNDGDTDVLSASSNDDKIAWYENFGDGNFGNQNIISTNADWAWSVYASDLDGDGNIDVLSASTMDDKLAWYRNNTFVFTSPQDVVVCLDNNTEFSIENTTNIESFQWQVLNGSAYENLNDDEHYSGTATQTLTINSVTSDMDNNHYRCLLTIGNNQVASKDAVLIVLPLPETEDITGNPNPAPFDTCIYAVPNPGNSSFDWTVEGGSIIGGTENSKDILWGDAGYGNLSVIETDTNGCQGIPVQLTIIIDIDELLAKYNIRVFPNPTSGKVRIEGDKIQKIEIIDMEGKPVRTFISKKGENFEIDLSGKPAGLYFISFILKDRTLVRKLILE
ncbi:MAG: hypothetical protein B6D61_12920 [Bacteroidetes bacterium 4484_249]|nr:MAG: hypothetical protein B6D61_12920 [Bacteroidetes bacterium 4484_249]